MNSSLSNNDMFGVLTIIKTHSKCKCAFNKLQCYDLFTVALIFIYVGPMKAWFLNLNW